LCKKTLQKSEPQTSDEDLIGKMHRGDFVACLVSIVLLFVHMKGKNVVGGPDAAVAEH
jgi:hypothetical protein